MSAERCASASQPVRWIGQPLHTITGVISANCSQWLRSMPGTQAACSNSLAMTATSTGAVSTAPTTTRRVRSAISARRSAACAASTSAAAGSTDGPISPPATAPSGAVPLPEAACASGSTSSVPWIMFIPHANPNDPALDGSSRTAVRWNAGSAAETPRSGKTTLEVQSPDSCRSKVTWTDTPWRTRITSGL